MFLCDVFVLATRDIKSQKNGAMEVKKMLHLYNIEIISTVTDGSTFLRIFYHSLHSNGNKKIIRSCIIQLQIIDVPQVTAVGYTELKTIVILRGCSHITPWGCVNNKSIHFKNLVFQVQYAPNIG